jgi:transposase
MPPSNLFYRQQVASMVDQGYSLTAIRRALRLPKNFVSRWIMNYQTRGNVLNAKKGYKTKKLSKKNLVKIQGLIARKRGVGVRKVSQHLKAHGVDLSKSSVWRGARKIGLKSYTRLAKPAMKHGVKKRRMTFARKYKDMNWTRVVFADEKIFTLYAHPNRKNDVVWTNSKKDVIPAPSVGHAQSINAFVAIWHDGSTKIHLFNETMTAKVYTDILTETLLPAANNAFGKKKWVYIQDGDPKHTAKHTQLFLEKNVPDFVRKDEWPPNSPDLNPVENLWATIGQEVSFRDPKNLTDLKSEIRKAWKKVATKDLLHKLLCSMPQRLKAVIKVRGGNTQY